MNLLKRRSNLPTLHFVVTYFEAFQDGTLTDSETKSFQQHLAACQECRDWVEQQVNLIERLQRGASPPSILSPSAIGRIQHNLYNRMRRSQIMNNVRIFVGGTAAIAVLAVIVGLFVLQNRNITTVEIVPPIMARATDEQIIEAIAARDTAAVEQFLKDGANPDAIDSSGDPILKSAIDLRNIDMVELLVEYGADVNALDGGGNMLLPQATHVGQLELVKLLLDAGADVHSTMSLHTRYNWNWNLTAAPALLHAVDRNRISIVELLITYGADVNQADKGYGVASLHVAALSNNVEIIKILLDNGADPNLHDDFLSRPPLHYATRNVSAEAAQALVDGGADVDDRDDQGRTPMMVLIMEGGRAKAAEIASILLDGGADPNVQDTNGNTALHYVARWGKAEVIPLLLEHGAVLDMENTVGKTALDIAAPLEEGIAEILRDAGASDRQ